MKDIRNIDKLSENNHNIDILFLNKFLLKEGDNFLDKLINEKYTFIKREDITKEFFQKYYKKIFNSDEIGGGINFIGNDFPLEWYNEDVIYYIRSTYSFLGIEKMLRLFPDDIFKNNNSVLKLLFSYNRNVFRFIPKDIDNYYFYVKEYFNWMNESLYDEYFPKEYIPRLTQDFPDNEELLKYKRDSLNENYRGYVINNNDVYLEDKINILSEKNSIDILSLNKFLLKEGDKGLNIILFKNRYIIPSKDRFQKNYMNILTKHNVIKNHYGYDDTKFSYLGSILPADYYTKEMVNNIIKKFGLFNTVLYGKINQMVDGFVDIIKTYLEKYLVYNINILTHIDKNIKGYFDLFSFVINKKPTYIAYLKNDYNRYEELGLLAVSIDEDSIKFIPSEKRTYDISKKAISKKGSLIKFVSLSDFNSSEIYSLIKLAYEQDKNIINDDDILLKIHFYLDRLKKDFPQDDELQSKESLFFNDPYNLLLESKVLLREEILNMESFNYKSDRNKIDLSSLNNFLLEKGDNFLDILLYVQGYKMIDYYSDLFKNEIIKHIYPNELRKVPNELWGDYSFCLLVSSKNPYTVEFIDEKYLEDYNIIKNILIQKGEFINKFNPDVLDGKLIRLANKTNDSGKDLTDTCYDWHFFPDRYKLLKKIISVYPDKIRYIKANEYKYAIDNKYYELFKIAYLKNKNILRYNNVIKHWVYFEKLKKDLENNSSLKEYISKEVKFLLREYLFKKKSSLL